MTQKVKAYVVGRFPFYHDDDKTFIGTSPTEVTLNPWLQAQVDAGLVAIVEDEPAPSEPNPKDKQPKEKQPKGE